LAYDGGLSVLSLTVSSSHQWHPVNVVIIDELARGAGRDVARLNVGNFGFWGLPMILGVFRAFLGVYNRRNRFIGGGGLNPETP